MLEQLHASYPLDVLVRVDARLSEIQLRFDAFVVLFKLK